MLNLRIRRSVLAACAVLVCLLAAALSRDASAQYFGRNKVQFRSFDFKVLSTDHFDIYFYPVEEDAAKLAGRIAEEWYARHSEVLHHQLRGRQPLILYSSHPDFEQTNAIAGDLGEGTGGVTDILKRRIVLPLAGPLAETSHVIGHELVHAFQFDMTGQGHSSVQFQAPGAARLPLWFIEGQAEYLSLGPVDPHTAMWMRDAAQTGKLPTIHQLNNPRYFPYRYGQAFWAYIGGRWGDNVVGEILRAAGRSGDADRAIQAVLGESVDSLSRDWQASLRGTYQEVLPQTKPPSSYGRLLIGEKRQGGQLNLAPSLSPDGNQLMFISERDIFSIEVYLADAHTGRVIRRITKTAVDPHYQSLEFINSSGAWSPDGRRFALAAVSKGAPLLSILDVPTGKTVREIPLKAFGEIFNPTWSPDGRRVALSVMVGGLTDLVVVDVESGSVQRLTHDAFADIEPAWSPDGKSIAFVTDRFSTKMSTLEYGNYRLALIDPETGDIRPLQAFANGKNINPQWSPDGSALYFVSDHTGISNIYRLPMDGGPMTQVTNVLTGISGLTSVSPAISVARQAGRMVFSTYEKGNYDLYAVDSLSVLAGQAPQAAWANNPADLAPRETKSGLVKILQGEAPPLAQRSEYRISNYHGGLSLDYVDQPSVGVGVGTGGVAVGGGTGLYWSDMLGNHQLATLIQLDTQAGTGNPLNSLGAVVEYQNLRSRLNWGTIVGQIPTILQAFNAGVSPDGVERDSTFTFIQMDRELQGVVSYPFSTVQRIELTGGFRRIDFTAQVHTQAFSLGGDLLNDETINLPQFEAPAINMGTGSAALVYDNSVFGGTSPLLGRRYRFEVEENLGGLNYTGILGDFRQYAMIARPFALAGRVLHYGRYGRDSEPNSNNAASNALSPLFLGYPYLIRGYNDGSFDAQELTTADSAAYSSLFGSRVAMANLEARLPLLGAVGLLRSPGIPPIEALAFYDAGVAWQQGQKPELFGGSRKMLTSYGGGMRVNLLGYAVAEIDYVHPNDRPAKGWYWEFSLQPGF